MTQNLLSRVLEDPPSRRGIRFFDGRGTWTFHPYTELADGAFAVAARLRDQGVAAGDVVTVLAGHGPGFVSAFLGTLAVGATPAPLAPQPVVQGGDGAYRRQAERVLTAVAPSVVVGPPEAEPTLAELCRGPGRPRLMTLTADDLAGGADGRCAPQAPPERALIQFTSGSSGTPKAVAVSFEALAANISAIRSWLRMGPDDATATWLPLHHDMGLVGCLLTPLASGSDLWVMRPEQFVRSPVEWLRCFGARGARLTASPAFGLAHVARRVGPEALEGMDFREWRAVITGAERIAPEVLRSFVSCLAPYGFSARALLPAYGLAEATLAVTGAALDDEPRTLDVDRRSLAVGRPVRVVGEHGRDQDAVTLVGCGRPLGGTSVLVTDGFGRPLQKGHLGEIVVGGPSVASGYTGGTPAARTVFSGRQIRTGDSGLLHDGELYVVGRLGDSVRCRATTVFAEDLEALVSQVSALQHTRPAVLLGSVHGADTAVVVVEGRPGPWAEDVVRLIRHRTDGISVVVITGPRGVVRRTSSGKPRRRAMWDAYTGGALGGTVVLEHSAALRPVGEPDTMSPRPGVRRFAPATASPPAS
ncbi:AMP-binding protein [Streptomyces sp. NPDC004270]